MKKLMDSMKEGQEEPEAGEEGAPPKQADTLEGELKEAQEGDAAGQDTPSGICVSATIGTVNLLLHSSKAGKLASVAIRGTVAHFSTILKNCSCRSYRSKTRTPEI